MSMISDVYRRPEDPGDFLTWDDKDEWPLTWFKPQELACKGSGALRVDRVSAHLLDELRRNLGRPVVVVSAYRTKRHNAAVGGASNSFHLRGMAFDLAYGSGRDGLDLVEVGLLTGFKGVGVYKAFIHLDTGPRRIWRG